MPLMNMAKWAVESDIEPKHRRYLERSVIQFPENDTILFREEEGKKLAQIQNERLNPLIDWFNNKYRTQVKINRFLDVQSLAIEDKDRIM